VKRHKFLPLLAALAALPCVVLAGCSRDTASSGAPPTVICGTTIWTAAAGAVVQNVSHGGSVTHVSAGENIFLRVSDSCSTGVSVTVDPSDAARVVTSAPSKDGKVTAVVLEPRQHVFTIRLTSPHRPSYVVKVDVADLPRAFATPRSTGGP